MPDIQTFFRELFEYNSHYNQKLITVIVKNSASTSEKSVRLLNHILNAHQIWMSRALNQTSMGVWDIHPVSELQQLDIQNHQKTLNILKSPDLSRIIHYSNSKGQAFTNSLRDILFHVINHSTYHRGQIASEFRQSGIEPLPTDYIFYKRSQAEES